MKTFFKKSPKYVLSAILLTTAFGVVNLKNFLNIFPLPATDKTVGANLSGGKFVGLPCGYKTVGLEDPHKPSFLTNNDIPALQYPAGNAPGTNFQIPDAVYSDSQSDQLILQSDGNLVIYCLSCNPGKALWSTQTNGKGGTALYFQTDGDLVLRNANHKVIWHSNIHSTCAGSELAYFTLQDDGNLAML